MQLYPSMNASKPPYTRLVEFPESGRPGRVEGTRELVMTNAPYILPYRIVDNTVRILRVLHSARLWPEAFPDSG